MWTLLAVLSAVLLGLYDVAKKKALQENGVFTVLLVATALSTLFLAPFFKLGPAGDYGRLALKAVLVTLSWISGMVGLKKLPLTIVSTIKGSRPVFVVLLSILIFGEHLNWIQWAGISLALVALWLLGQTSSSDGSVQARREGFIFMGISVVTGVASALYDKYIIQGMEPLFVQCWTNLFITIILAAVVVVRRLVSRLQRPLQRPRRSVSETFVENRSSVAADRSVAKVAVSPGGPPQRGEGEIGVPTGFRWDWTLVVVAVLITGADMLYFFALKQPDALLSVVSVVRRTSVLVTFVAGAIIFKEKRIRAKALNMLLMVVGVVLLLLGSQ